MILRFLRFLFPKENLAKGPPPREESLQDEAKRRHDIAGEANLTGLEIAEQAYRVQALKKRLQTRGRSSHVHPPDNM